MSTTLDRPNRYPAACVRCGGRVAANQGHLARDDDGRWAADHLGECPDKPMSIAAPTPTTLVDEDGIYRTDDGTIYKAVRAVVEGSGRLYAKRLVITQQPDGSHRGRFTYAPGAIHILRADHKLTAAEAAQYGRLYGVCVACASQLTDEDSIARGMGPICAGKFA